MTISLFKNPRMGITLGNYSFQSKQLYLKEFGTWKQSDINVSINDTTTDKVLNKALKVYCSKNNTDRLDLVGSIFTLYNEIFLCETNGWAYLGFFNDLFGLKPSDVGL